MTEMVASIVIQAFIIGIALTITSGVIIRAWEYRAQIDEDINQVINDDGIFNSPFEEKDDEYI